MYGKISKVTKTNGTVITYTYDAAGNRISKKVTGTGASETWYVRDASGNVMSTYNMATSGGVTYATWSDADVYGSSRVATYNPKFNMLDGRPPLVNIPKIGDIAYYNNFSRGLKLFELTNHLGNVLATVTDTKIPVNNGNTISYYTANLINATEYAPFGMRMRGRDSTLQAYNTAYRFGFNGKEQDRSITSQDYDYGMRIYDTRVGRFLSVDPITKEYPFYSPYNYAGNSPIKNLDFDGGEPKDFMKNWQYQTLYDLNKGQELAGTGTDIFVSTAKVNNYDVQLVYDQATKQQWFVHQEGSAYYYLKNDDGNSGVMTVDANKYNLKRGHFEKFETGDQRAMRLAGESADMIAKATFGVFAAGAALPAASYLGGPLLETSLSQSSFNVGLTKALVGGVTDALAQKTSNPEAPINLWSVGASALFSNPFVSSAIGSSLSINTNGDIKTSNFQNIAVNTLVGGGLGASFGKFGLSYQTRGNVKFGDAAIRGSINLIPSYWDGIVTNATSEKAVSAFDNNKK